MQGVPFKATSSLSKYPEPYSHRCAFAAIKEDRSAVTRGQSAFGGDSSSVQKQHSPSTMEHDQKLFLPPHRMGLVRPSRPLLLMLVVVVCVSMFSTGIFNLRARGDVLC